MEGAAIPASRATAANVRAWASPDDSRSRPAASISSTRRRAPSPRRFLLRLPGAGATSPAADPITFLLSSSPPALSRERSDGHLTAELRDLSLDALAYRLLAQEGSRGQAKEV